MHDNQTISFYNSIASEYEEMLEKEQQNKMVRQTVAENFQKFVKDGLVLDFGGGTGLDLDWLTKYSYKIIFCEPSDEMREIAIKKNPANNSIQFLSSEKTNFYNWKNNLPFSEEADAILCNFAVLNCIDNLGTLFESLALVSKPSANLFALVLDNDMRALMKKSKRKTILSFFGIPFKIQVHWKRHRQTVHLHSDKAIKKAFKKFFVLNEKKLLSEYGFCLYHLIRK